MAKTVINGDGYTNPNPYKTEDYDYGGNGGFVTAPFAGAGGHGNSDYFDVPTPDELKSEIAATAEPDLKNLLKDDVSTPFVGGANNSFTAIIFNPELMQKVTLKELETGVKDLTEAVKTVSENAKDNKNTDER